MRGLLLLSLLALNCSNPERIVKIPEVGIYDVKFKIYSAKEGTPDRYAFYYDNCRTYQSRKLLLVEKKYKGRKNDRWGNCIHLRLVENQELVILRMK